ncbi:uncharacterized protein LOC116805293 [Drosophila grimshawi]|nr:uncharacterized protein LOC116805293 [Drosophila grimshawi]
MMRLKELELDQVEERAKEEVRSAFIVFGVICATIRLVPILLRRLTS